jgi:hypothetical protein
MRAMCGSGQTPTAEPRSALVLNDGVGGHVARGGWPIANIVSIQCMALEENEGSVLTFD